MDVYLLFRWRVVIIEEKMPGPQKVNDIDVVLPQNMMHIFMQI
jgi:hypothetical protein